jgi:hypothetical protein
MSDGYRSPSDLSLSADETRLLLAALLQWCGPANCSEEFAVAMGFRNATLLSTTCWKIRYAIERDEPLQPMDWARAILATEVGFASDLMGCGVDWGTLTGLRDHSAVETLRSVQRKLASITMPLRGKGLGTYPAMSYGPRTTPMSAASIALINDLVRQYPELAPVLDEHFTATGSEIRPYKAMQEIVRSLAHRQDSLQLAQSVFNWLESAYAGSDDPDVRSVITGGVKWIPDPGQRGDELRAFLGPRLSEVDPWSS